MGEPESGSGWLIQGAGLHAAEVEGYLGLQKPGEFALNTARIDSRVIIGPDGSAFKEVPEL